MVSDPPTSIRNTALAALEVLVGTWQVEITNASFLEPGTRSVGTMTASWLDGQALLVLRSQFPSGPPASVQVVGRNEDRDDFVVLYADERGVSRVYAMTFAGGGWTQSRADPGFHQRFAGRLADGGRRIDAAWSRSHDDGVTWEHDFDLTYTRV